MNNIKISRNDSQSTFAPKITSLNDVFGLHYAEGPTSFGFQLGFSSKE